MRKLVAALACRNKSSRLFGKPLQNIDIEKNYTILDFLIGKLKKINCINEIVLGISEGDENRVFINYAKKYKIKYIIGDEINVLSRLIECANSSKATDVFRITTESPFPYLNILEETWLIHTKENYDASFLDYIIDGCGFEIIKTSALILSNNQGSKIHRSELCTLFIRQNLEKFKVNVIKPEDKYIRNDLRLTVDYPEDLIVCRNVFDYLEKNNIKSEKELDQIIKFLDANTKLKDLISKYCKDGYSTMYKNGKK